MRLTEREYALLTGQQLPNTQEDKGTSLGVDSYKSNVRGWRTIGGTRYYFRSLYEINYAHVLEFLKRHNKIKDWVYEPTTFKYPKDAYNTGPFFYKPDFLVTFPNNTTEWHEVKGWMNPSSKKKLKRFLKHYPDETLKVIDGDWFKKYAKHFKPLIPHWEVFVPSPSSSNRGYKKQRRDR